MQEGKEAVSHGELGEAKRADSKARIYLLSVAEAEKHGDTTDGKVLRFTRNPKPSLRPKLETGAETRDPRPPSFGFSPELFALDITVRRVSTCSALRRLSSTATPRMRRFLPETRNLRPEAETRDPKLKHETRHLRHFA